MHAVLGDYYTAFPHLLSTQNLTILSTLPVGTFLSLILVVFNSSAIINMQLELFLELQSSAHISSF